MKKVLFFTVFAILGLASCSKSEIEYDNQPQEISLFAVNKVATKAPVRGADFPYNMAVAAYLAAGDGVTTGRNYFTTTQFSKNVGSSYWTGGKYWPISAATLNFLAVAPEETGVVTTSINDDLATSTTNVTNNHIWDKQYDVMYAAVRASKKAGSAPDNPDGNAELGADVDMVFKHAYVLVDFYFTQSTSTPKIIINSITVNDVACNGKLTLTVNNSTSTTGSINVVQDWSGYDPNTDIVVPTDPTSVYFELSTVQTRYHEGIMLIPNKAMSSFVINYTIDGQTFDYTYTPDPLLTWTAGTKYTYNITMTPSLIQVDPTVTPWADNETNMELDTPTP